MLRRAAIVCASLVLAACAALMNSGRPKYDGPILMPLWHNAELQVTDPPVIRASVVYAIGQSWGTQRQTVQAFDLRSGRRIWSGRTPAAHIIAIGERTIFTDDGHGIMRVLSSASGVPVKDNAPRSVDHATLADGVLYLTGREGSLSALGPSGKKLWSRQFTVPAAAGPVVAGQAVYVYGRRHGDQMTPDQSAVYAFDRKTGAPLWKRELRETFGKYRYDATTKAMRWLIKPQTITIPAVLADDRAAYVWEQYQNETPLISSSVLIAIDTRGKTRWQHRVPGICLDSPNLLQSDALLACGGWRGPEEPGAFYDALLRRTGATLWRGATSWNYERYIPDGQFAIVSDRRVHQVLNENNDTSPDSWLTLVDRRTGREVWRTQVVQLADFTLAAVGQGVVLVGSKPFNWSDPQVEGGHSVAGLWAWPMRTK